MPRRYRKGRRAEAVEETRRRILMATMQLHGERGILATGWDDIARAAGVSLATVYRHFPSLDELVPACGALAEAYIRPPRPELAGALFEGAETAGERLERLTAELCAFYERGRVALSTARREGHAVEPLGAWARELDRAREGLVRAALGSGEAGERRAAVVSALTSFAVWEALAQAGVGAEEARGVMRTLVVCALGASSG